MPSVKLGLDRKYVDHNYTIVRHAVCALKVHVHGMLNLTYLIDHRTWKRSLYGLERPNILCKLQADCFLAPQLDTAFKRFNLDMVMLSL